MKLIAEYVEKSEHFYRMADEATDAALKQQLREQAAAYYKLAVKRAKETALKAPDPPPQSKLS